MTRRAAAAIALGLGVLAAPPGAAQERQVFRGGTTGVRLDVIVTHEGRPVTGLTAADFEVRENGILQRVELATTAGHVAVALVLDTSGSVQQEGLDELVLASDALVNALRPDDVAWFLTFARQFTLEVGPTRDAGAVRDALRRIRPGGGTSLWDSIFSAVSLVTGHAGRSLVLVFSDGLETTGWLDERRALETLRRAEVVVEAVRPRRGGLGGFLPLEAAAHATGGTVRDAAPGPALGDQFVGLLEEFRAGYVLTYVPRGYTPAGGWHKLDVRLKNRKGKVRVRPGYYSPPRR